MGDTDSFSRVEPLKDEDGFPSWELTISALLIDHGLYSYLTKDPILISDETQKEKAQKCWSKVVGTLSKLVQSGLPNDCRDPRKPNAFLLWKHLQERYGSLSMTRQGQLLQILFGTKVQPGEDPAVALGTLQSAHQQLVSAGVEFTADKVLAFAMSFALPEEYAVVKQNLWQSKALTSQMVSEDARMEYGRKNIERQGQAMAVFQPASNQQYRTPIQNPNQPCHIHIDSPHKHTNGECLRQGGTPAPGYQPKRFNKSNKSNSNPASANVAQGEGTAYCSALAVIGDKNIKEMFIDTGANYHMVFDASLLTNVATSPIVQNVRVGSGQLLPVAATGTLQLGPLTLNKVLVVPGLAVNLLSVSKTPDTHWWKVNSQGATCYDKSNNTVIHAPCRNGLYTIQASHLHALLATSEADPLSELKRWHEKLGHLNAQGVLDMARRGKIEGLEGVNMEHVRSFECEACILGKGKRLPSPNAPPYTRATKLLELLHIDIWGPASTTSIAGSRYFLTTFDDYSGHIEIYFLKAKSEALSALKLHITKAETQTGHKVLKIRSDGGGEFMSNMAKAYYGEKGIEHVVVPPGSHAQNGRVERVHLTIFDSVRTYLTAAGLPPYLWAEAAQHAVRIRNNVPAKPSNAIPNELWYGKPTSFIDYQPFGQPIFFRIHEAISKLAPRYTKGILVGYEPGSTTCRIWDSSRRKIITSRDVLYPKSVDLVQELTMVNLNGGSDETEDVDPEPIGEGGEIDIPPPGLAIDEEADDMRDSPRPESPPPDQLNNDQLRPSPVRERRRSPRFQEQPAPNYQEQPTDSESEPDSDESDDDPLLLTDENAALCNIAIALHHALDPSCSTPNSYLQARHSNEWDRWEPAMKAELDKMEKYRVYTVVDRTPEMRVIGGKWVYTRKIDGESGMLAAFKARWVAKGFSQLAGVDFDEIFAGVAHKDTIRVFLALVNHDNLECDQVDIVAAFLNGDIDKVLYMDPPEGSGIPAGKVVRLDKCLYGLHQSPRQFNKALDSWLKEQGFIPSRADACLYIRTQGEELIMLSLHVDDQLIASNSRPALDLFKSQLNAKFECKDMGPVGYFLGFNIYRDREQRKLYISQEHYIEALLDRFGMADCSPNKIPLPSGFKPIPATDDEFAKAKHLPYAQIVGSILYASTISRPDLAQPASVLSRFISKWNESHYAAAKHLLRYIRGTSDLCLVFDANCGKRIIEGYADADWGGDLDTRRSTTGYIYKVWGGVIAWKSKRQPTVALSTTEAEYMASADATRQAIWLRLLLEDLRRKPLEGPVIIRNDNNGAIALSKNPVHHERSKHIAMRHHFLREQVEDKAVRLDFVPSANNLADMLTKSLPQVTLERLRGLIGMAARKIGLS